MKNWRLDPTVVPIERQASEKERTESKAGKPLGELVDYSNPVGIAEFPAGEYPACQTHGALLCMTPPQPDKPAVWRCDACGAGATWVRHGQ